MLQETFGKINKNDHIIIKKDFSAKICKGKCLAQYNVTGAHTEITFNRMEKCLKDFVVLVI